MHSMTIHGRTVVAESRLLDVIKALPKEKALKAIYKLEIRNSQTDFQTRGIGPRGAGSQLAGWISSGASRTVTNKTVNRQEKVIDGNPLVFIY